MPEALNNRNNTVPLNFEIKHRDEREAAAKNSKRTSEAKVEEDNRKRIEKTVERRETIRTSAEEDKKAVAKETMLRKGEENIQKRQGQDKANPETGNIINVIV